MTLSFTANTNKDYCMINEAIFHLSNGGSITLDRDETCYSIENGRLTMDWYGVYLWAINECYIFDEPNVHPASEICELLDDSWVELVLEDDADEDYEVTNVSWSACSDGLYAKGTDFPKERL